MRAGSLRKMSPSLVAVLTAIGWSSTSPCAFAQATSPSGLPGPSSDATTQQALAQTMFDQAKKLMADGRYPEACARFADSNRLAPGTGTLLNLATCHLKIGKLTTAWLELKNAADGDRREGNTLRLQWIQTQIANIDPQLDYLTVTVPPATPADLTVTLDGVKFDPAAWGTATPLDPGGHVVQASAPGYQTWTKQVTLAATSDKQTVEVPLLTSTTVATVPPVVTIDHSPPHEEPATDVVDNKRRTIAYVLGGTAIVGIGVGTIFGIKTFSDWSSRNDNCPGGRCNQTAVDDSSSAKTAAVVSDISFGVAIVAAAAGTYLYLTSKHAAPRDAGMSTSLRVGGSPLPGGGAASLSARF